MFTAKTSVKERIKRPSAMLARKARPRLKTRQLTCCVVLLVLVIFRRSDLRTTESNIPANFLDDLCILVKAHDRPGCAERFVRSLRRFSEFDALYIFVSDDGQEALESVFPHVLRRNVFFIRNEIDAGVSRGRNELVQAAIDHGFKYIFMADDDYVFPTQDVFWKLSEQLFQKNADIVALTRCESYFDCSRGLPANLVVDVDSRIWKFKPFALVYSPQRPLCVQSDLVQQIFLARIELFHSVRWDPRLKNNDHYDFLFTCKVKGFKLYTCPGLRTLHQPSKCSDRSMNSSYMQVRHKRWRKLLPYVLDKWNIAKLVDETGKEWSI